MNGVELGGGSIRICRSSLQEHIFKNVLKIPCEEFAHLLKCLDYGCPPHGGIALGTYSISALQVALFSLKLVKGGLSYIKGFVVNRPHQKERHSGHLFF